VGRWIYFELITATLSTQSSGHYSHLQTSQEIVEALKRSTSSLAVYRGYFPSQARGYQMLGQGSRWPRQMAIHRPAQNAALIDLREYRNGK